MSFIKLFPYIIKILKGINSSESIWTNTPMWASLVAVGCMWLANHFDVAAISAQDQGVILAFIMGFFQFFTTGKFRFWSKKTDTPQDKENG
jgi:hypothetical protein